LCDLALKLPHIARIFKSDMTIPFSDFYWDI